MKFTDIIELAKSGWSLKDVKEALELAETSPEVQKADIEEVKNNDGAVPAPEAPKPVETPQPQEQPEGSSVLDKLFD